MFLLQQIPEDYPTLVKPNAEKIDLSAIRNTVPKYQSLDEMDKSWWFDFLEQLEISFHLFATAQPTTVLRDIESIVESCHSILIQPQAATNVSDLLLKRHRDSTDTIPEVIIVQKAIIIIVIIIINNNK